MPPTAVTADGKDINTVMFPHGIRFHGGASLRNLKVGKVIFSTIDPKTHGILRTR